MYESHKQFRRHNLWLKCIYFNLFMGQFCEDLTSTPFTMWKGPKLLLSSSVGKYTALIIHQLNGYNIIQNEI